MGCYMQEDLFFSSFFSYRSSSALHRRSSTEILPDYWGTFCAGVYPMPAFSFLVAAGFEPTSLSLRSRRLNRYPILSPWDTSVNSNILPLTKTKDSETTVHAKDRPSCRAPSRPVLILSRVLVPQVWALGAAIGLWARKVQG